MIQIKPNLGVKVLHYSLNDFPIIAEEIHSLLQERIDYSDPTELIEHRETVRLALGKASKLFMSIDYICKKLGVRSGEEYAMYSSFREFAEMMKKDIETSIMIMSNTINYFKHER